MKKIISYILACLSVTNLLVGCSEIENHFNPSSTRVTVTAQMPETNTRAGLSQDDNTLNLLTKWQNDDEVKVILLQGDQKFEVGKVPIVNISSDGKKASFSYDIPSELDITKSYKLYAFCGIEGFVDKKDNGDWYAYCTAKLLRTEMSKLKAPLASCTEITMNTPVVQFQHFQTYELLHVKNASSGSITFQHEGFDVVNPWYRGVPNMYDFTTWSPGALPQVWHNEASSETVTIPAEETACIISTYLPSGYQMKDASLRAKINGNLSVVKSANKKTSDIDIETGRAYHMYATWDGEKLTFDNGDTGILTVEPNPIEFGSVEAGTTATANFTVSNTGNAELNFRIQDLHDIFDVPESGQSFTLQVGESRQFTITFTPEAEEKDKSYSEVITITSNGLNGTIVVPVAGKSKSREEERLTQVIPDDMRDKFDDYIPIYDGSNPPNIEGEFIISPYEIIFDSTNGYSSGSLFSDRYVKFFNQDVLNNTIDFCGKQASSESTGSGCFISGDGNKFSVFFNTEGVTHTSSYDVYIKQAVVISGIKTDGGIKDMYYGFIFVEKSDDPNNELIKVGDFRSFKDSDGMSEYNWWTSGANGVRRYIPISNRNMPNILDVARKK